MVLTDRLFALRRIPPFERLGSSELLLIADVTRARRFDPGAVLGVAGQPLTRLHVVTTGGFENAAGSPAPTILGLPSLLFDHPLDAPWQALDQGASTLEIGRGHLFTILSQCPDLTLGLLEGEALAPQTIQGAP